MRKAKIEYDYCKNDAIEVVALSTDVSAMIFRRACIAEKCTNESSEDGVL